MIKFNKPPYLTNTLDCMNDSMLSGHISGDGKYTKKCKEWLEGKYENSKVLLTTSCTHALEMAAILIDIQPGDEVIMPSFTFVSTANAFVLRGAKIIFIDIDNSYMNIDPTLIEGAITNKTKAVVPVHYAGISCDMDMVMTIANKHNLYVIEDAAQAIGSFYNGKSLGSFGHMSTLSFHETKNITSAGEGGALIINDDTFSLRAEIIREKGTNRSQFFRGQIDKYHWIDIGSSYLMNDVSAAYLWSLLENEKEITANRLLLWAYYKKKLSVLEKEGRIKIQCIPNSSIHNAHMFYLKLDDLELRTKFISHLKNNNIMAVFHYIPLHSSIAGEKYGAFHGEDKNTTVESERIVRLPIYYGMCREAQDKVMSSIYGFFGCSYEK